MARADFVTEIRAVTALVIVGTFLSGAAAGAGVYHWAAPHRDRGMHRPPSMPPPAELGLTAEQEVKAHEIVNRHRPEIESVLRETFPKVRAVHERIDQELRAILNDEQRAKFEAWKARHPRPTRPDFGRHEH